MLSLLMIKRIGARERDIPFFFEIECEMGTETKERNLRADFFAENEKQLQQPGVNYKLSE